jgi:hypothetical protein
LSEITGRGRLGTRSVGYGGATTSLSTGPLFSESGLAGFELCAEFVAKLLGEGFFISMTAGKKID